MPDHAMQVGVIVYILSKPTKTFSACFSTIKNSTFKLYKYDSRDYSNEPSSDMLQDMEETIQLTQ